MNRDYSFGGDSAKSADGASAVIPRTVQRRWEAAGDVLRLLHTRPGITRAQAVEQLGLSSASASDIFDRLRGHALLAESPAPVTGRGRPTTVLTAAPDGPLVAVVDLAGSGWRVLLADLAGDVQEVAAGGYGGAAPDRFVPRVATALADGIAAAGDRVRIVSAAVAGTVTGGRLLQFAGVAAEPTDLAGLLRELPRPVPLIVGNDATLGGLAEARTGVARGCASSVHVLLTGGIGAVLVVDGDPVLGATGAAGEFGHLPFGDPERLCPCGAHGCWGTQVDGGALARGCGDPEPDDPATYSDRFLAVLESGSGTAGQRDAAQSAAHAFGRGIGALVNAHDPAVVTIGGLGPRLRDAAPGAFTAGYTSALMAFRRGDPPPVRSAQHRDGPVTGAISRAIDQVTGPGALEQWVAR